MLHALGILTNHNAFRFFLPSLFHVIPSLLGLAPYLFVFLVVGDIAGADHGTPTVPWSWKPILCFVGIVACAVLKFILARSSYLRVYIMGYELGTELRIRLGEHLRRLPMSFFKERDLGDVAALMLQDIYKLEMNLTHVYQQVTASIGVAVIILGILFPFHSTMSLLILTTIAVALPVLAVTQKVVKHFGEKLSASRNGAASRILEYLLGMRVLKAHNQTGSGFKRLESALARLRTDSILLEAVPVPFVTSFAFILETGYMGLLLLGAWSMLGGTGTLPGDVLLLFLIVGHQIYESLKRMSIFIPEMRQMDVAGDRIGAILATEPLREPEKDPRLERFDIALEDVSFGYGPEYVLKNIDFSAREKSVTALVGPSGAGKSTIVSLIPRFWDVGAGVVRIGGVDVREIKHDHLLSCLSMVFQEVYLFNDTVYENIRMGRSDATREQILAAAASARCSDFVQKLPQGYETVVGEGGSTLSGGEKQRISIARAILKDAPIVLLDEATASLDPENEVLIQEAIGKLVQSRTLIVIAHRLYTIRRADQILVLDKGEIVERGRHEDLMEQGGLYARLWKEQQRASGWKFMRMEGKAVSNQRNRGGWRC